MQTVHWRPQSTPQPSSCCENTLSQSRLRARMAVYCELVLRQRFCRTSACRKSFGSVATATGDSATVAQSPPPTKHRRTTQSPRPSARLSPTPDRFPRDGSRFPAFRFPLQNPANCSSDRSELGPTFSLRDWRTRNYRSRNSTREI
jgi:hypothetical protein